MLPSYVLVAALVLSGISALPRPQDAALVAEEETMASAAPGVSGGAGLPGPSGAANPTDEAELPAPSGSSQVFPGGEAPSGEGLGQGLGEGEGEGCKGKGKGRGRPGWRRWFWSSSDDEENKSETYEYKWSETHSYDWSTTWEDESWSTTWGDQGPGGSVPGAGGGPTSGVEGNAAPSKTASGSTSEPSGGLDSQSEGATLPPEEKCRFVAHSHSLHHPYTYKDIVKLYSLVDPFVTPFLLARSLTVSFLNPFRRAQAEADAGQITVQVKWGRDRYNIPIPQPSLTPLSKLLATLSNQTSLPIDSIKLIYKGAVLKDQSLTLTSYGIKDGSTLVLVGKDGNAPGMEPPKPTTNATGPIKGKVKQPDTSTESVLVDWIKSLVENTLGPLQPSIATFVSYTSPKATNRPPQIPKFDVLQKEHARLSEVLLRGLLDLDSVEIPSGWADARKERKEGVKRVQAELTKVDDAWGERKKLGA